MLGFLGDLLIMLLLGGVIGYIFILLSEGIGGGIIIRGTKKYNKFQRDSDRRIRNILKNGSGSSRQELQEWWDKYHPPK